MELGILNCGYKLLTKILAKRIHKILPSVIKSVQSCSVRGSNICSSAFNLVSFIQSIESSNGKAAILSLDLFKAFDRVNLSYLEKVMEKMQFHSVFISWILLLHDGARTKFLLDKLSNPIEILFSVRQGDPIALILFIIFIEPLLLRIAEEIQGYKLMGQIMGPTNPTIVEGVEEKLEAYVDDVQNVITCDEEFNKVDKVVRDFESLSGTILNRDSKSKVMGFGQW